MGVLPNALSPSHNVLKALAHPIRIQILQVIDSFKESNVNQIFETLGVEQSVASQHLRVLRLNKLVTARREGKFVYYSIHYDQVKQATEAAATLAIFMRR